YKPTPVRLRYVPRHPLGFLQTPLLPVAPLPAGYLPAGWAVGFLSTHRLGRHAGRTAKGTPKSVPSLQNSLTAHNLPDLPVHVGDVLGEPVNDDLISVDDHGNAAPGGVVVLPQFGQLGDEGRVGLFLLFQAGVV